MITSYAFTTAKIDFLVLFYAFSINAKNISSSVCTNGQRFWDSDHETTRVQLECSFSAFSASISHTPHFLYTLPLPSTVK